MLPSVVLTAIPESQVNQQYLSLGRDSWSGDDYIRAAVFACLVIFWLAIVINIYVW